LRRRKIDGLDRQRPAHSGARHRCRCLASIVDHAVEVASKPLAVANALQRGRQARPRNRRLDLFLSSSGWDLWRAFGGSVERTSDRLARWWAEPFSAKALLILDGLSCANCRGCCRGQGARLHPSRGWRPRFRAARRNRRICPRPWLRQPQQAPEQWRRSQRTAATGADGNRRSAVEGLRNPDRQRAQSSLLAPLARRQAARWLRRRPGAGAVDARCAEQLTSDDFWAFVERLATGRRLVITSDHGYAATGYFPDADGEVGQFLKQTFSSGRSKPGTGDPAPSCRPWRCKSTARTARTCWRWAAGNGAARAATRRSRMAAYRCSKCCRPSSS
jgi:hypothetical protein